MADDQKPLRVIGGFELITKIGQGGMGTVFKARQVSLDRIVAVKILPPSIAKDTKFIEHFQREARASARLNHPNIVQGIDVGQDAATGLWYFAMEYVDGPSLKALLTEQKTIPEIKALEVARQMASALECAQANGIVHRDIKPDNILLTSRGDAKLADLGLARHVSEEAVVVEKGGKAQAVGTPYYMAPEQCRGEVDKIDIRTDMYALGATLFHLVTGQPPFSGPNGAAIMVKHLADKPPLAHRVADDVSEPCGRLIERMMQKEREKRIQTPKELGEQIDKVLKLANLAKRTKAAAAPKVAKVADTALRAPVSVRAAGPRRVRGQLSGAIAGIALVGVVTAVLLWTLSRPKPGPGSGSPTEKGLAAANGGKTSTPLPGPKPTPAKRTGPDTPPKEKAPPPPSTGTAQPPLPPIVGAPPSATDKKGETPATTDTKTEKPTPPNGKKDDTDTKETDPVKPVATDPATKPQPGTEPKAAPQPAGPDPALQAALARFLNEMTKRSAAERKDLPRVLSEMNDLAGKPEFAAVQIPIAEELKDLERVIRFEEKAVDALGAAKGDLDLPDDIAKLARGEKTGKIVRSDRGRLYVSVGGVELAVPAAKLPPRKVVDAAASGKLDSYAAADYYFLRGVADGAKPLLPTLSEEERARFERKLQTLKAGEAEMAAEAAYKEILTAIRAKQWKQVREKIIVFDAVHGQTAIGQQKTPALAAFKEFAEQTLAPPPPAVAKLFHAKSVKALADGSLQLTYDFTDADQVKDFACDHGALGIEKGWMKVPEGGEEFAQARFIVPIAELRAMEVTGKSFRAAEPGESERFGVYIVPPGGVSTELNRVPKCLFRVYDRKPHLEMWEPPYIQGRMNAIGTKEGNWATETVFLAEATANVWKWTVAGTVVGQVKLPPTAVGCTVAFVGNGGDHAWHDFKIIFKPDPAWLKQQSAPPKARP
ncbi:MAG: protein kinase [Planctomycetota bacterium]|nr:protein kinase [Planctomycetota bacterium]